MEASYTIWLPPLFVTSAAGAPRCTRAARVLGDGNRSLLDRGCVHFSDRGCVHFSFFRLGKCTECMPEEK